MTDPKMIAVIASAWWCAKQGLEIKAKDAEEFNRLIESGTADAMNEAVRRVSSCLGASFEEVAVVGAAVAGISVSIKLGEKE